MELRGLDDALRAELRSRAVPAPLHVTRDPLRLRDDRRLDVPATSHWPQLTKPAELARAILDAVG